MVSAFIVSAVFCEEMLITGSTTAVDVSERAHVETAETAIARLTAETFILLAIVFLMINHPLINFLFELWTKPHKAIVQILHAVLPLLYLHFNYITLKPPIC